MKKTSTTEQKPVIVTEKAFKEFLDKQIGDLHDRVSYKERREAIESATELFTTGKTNEEDGPMNPPKELDTYTERALKKLALKGKYMLK